MDTLQKINFLIDQHVEIPYKDCPGCEHCKEIERISKEAGLWLGDSLNQKMSEGKKRAKLFTKEKLKRYLDEGASIRAISRKENFHESTVRRKIEKWFPECLPQKRPDLMPFERYIEMRKAGYKNPAIARQENINYDSLRNQLRRWQEEGKFSEQAI